MGAGILPPILSAPILFEKYLMGVVQVINRKKGDRFTPTDEKAILDIAGMFGIAFYTQKRLSRGRGRFSLLLDKGVLSEEILSTAKDLAVSSGKPVEAVLMEKFQIKKEEIGRSFSHFFKAPFVGMGAPPEIPFSLLKGLKVDFMKRNRWTPWRMEGGQVDIAIDDPNDLDRIDAIKPLFPGCALRFCVALEQDIADLNDRLTERFKAPEAIDDLLLRMARDAPEEEGDPCDMREQDSTVIQLVNKMILDAMDRRASDIHVEPYPGRRETEIRIRVDGECRLYGKIPAAYKHAVVSRIKVMADLDIAERRRPQDGKIDFEKFGKKAVELRVATLPTRGDSRMWCFGFWPRESPFPLTLFHFLPKTLQNFFAPSRCPTALSLSAAHGEREDHNPPCGFASPQPCSEKDLDR